MATKDAVITLIGSQAVVRKVEILIDAKTGNYKLGVYGETKDSGGRTIGLDLAIEDSPAGTAVLDAIWSHALPVLRKANGLE